MRKQKTSIVLIFLLMISVVMLTNLFYKIKSRTKHFQSENKKEIALNKKKESFTNLFKNTQNKSSDADSIDSQKGKFLDIFKNKTSDEKKDLSLITDLDSGTNKSGEDQYKPEDQENQEGVESKSQSKTEIITNTGVKEVFPSVSYQERSEDVTRLHQLTPYENSCFYIYFNYYQDYFNVRWYNESQECKNSLDQWLDSNSIDNLPQDYIQQNN
jgi:lipopolysaccharide export LptBFGC system permease protein LptF